MRAILIAATALTVLSIPANAQVDHMNLTYPACVTPLHLSEADALWHAGRPVNNDFCLMLPEGTEVVRVSYQYPYDYMQIAYQVNGKTFTLFTNPSAMKGVIDENKAAAERHRKEDAEHEALLKAIAVEEKLMQADIDVLETKHHRCTMYQKLGMFDPICKGIADAIADKGRERHEVRLKHILKGEN